LLGELTWQEKHMFEKLNTLKLMHDMKAGLKYLRQAARRPAMRRASITNKLKISQATRPPDFSKFLERSAVPPTGIG
jgi:hypothetical protein